jgi:hypothetical protein
MDDYETEKGVRICMLGCGDHGAPYTSLVWAGYTRMKAILAGQNDDRIRNTLVCRASIEYLGDIYTLIAFGMTKAHAILTTEPQLEVEKGVLSMWDFLRAMNGYRSYTAPKCDVYIIRHKAGELVSFQQKDDPFLETFGLRDKEKPSRDFAI